MSYEFPLNPDYGKGIFRRRIRLTSHRGAVSGELEDCSHGFRVRIEHDGHAVTAISAETLRVPMTTCPGAIGPLQELVGIPLDSSTMQILKRVDIRSNCTHLYDLSLLAISQARRERPERLYDVSVDDQQPGGDEPAAARVYLDGELVHEWTTRHSRIVEPEEFAGNSVMRGFTFWANRRFEGDANEAAFVLQKGIFVSSARILDMSGVEGDPATSHPFMQGVCYSYSSPQVEKALRHGHTQRDFTDTPEQLLQFL